MISSLTASLEGNKKGTGSNKKNLSRSVPWVGIEPTLQWNASLSRARLPIPPPRHFLMSTIPIAIGTDTKANSSGYLLIF